MGDDEFFLLLKSIKKPKGPLLLEVNYPSIAFLATTVNLRVRPYI